jgi:hypothetical protein
MPGRGGVGFFADAGERARLYWMKVSKNQDWLGVVCSFLAGSGAAQTAEIWNPGVPADFPLPPPPPHRPYAALAEAAECRTCIGGPQRARIRTQGRIQLWSC